MLTACFLPSIRETEIEQPIKVGLHAITGYKQEASYLSMLKGIDGWQSILRNSNRGVSINRNATRRNFNIICGNTYNKDNVGHLNIVFDARWL